MASGTTETIVTVDALGVTTILPAQTQSGVSLNEYDSFSVSAPGAVFDNRTTGATLIVNEVTSSSPSLIAGDISLLGEDADIVIANPNGITVNGGGFMTTGNVALTTGDVILNSSGLLETNVTSGEIAIGSDGLVGKVSELALISRSLRAEGEIDLDLNGHFNALTGANRVLFDPAFGNGSVIPWARIIERSDQEGGVAIDITRDSKLSAGRISMTATDQGAGVSAAGDYLAGVDGFRISADGRIEIGAGTISAAQSVSVEGAEITAIGETSPLEITSETSGVVLSASEGSLKLEHALVTGRQTASDSLSSLGAITLLGSEGVTTAGETKLVSTLGDIVVRSDRALKMSDTSAASPESLSVSAFYPILLERTGFEAGDKISFLTADQFTLIDSALLASSRISLQGAEVGLRSEDAGRDQTSVISEDSDVVISATQGDLVNAGGLIQGFLPDDLLSPSDASVMLSASGDISNEAVSADRLGIVFGQAGSVSIDAGGVFYNRSGRVLSNRALRISAADAIINETATTKDDERLKDGAFSATNATEGLKLSNLFLFPKRTARLYLDLGSYVAGEERGLLFGFDSVDLESPVVSNFGADVSGGILSITADRIENLASYDGLIDYKMSCQIMCRGSGIIAVTAQPGAFNSFGSLTLNATEAIVNEGGSFTAAGDITFNTPLFELRPLFLPFQIDREDGVFKYFRGRSTWIGFASSFGGFLSEDGVVRFSGDIAAPDSAFLEGDGFVVEGTILEPTFPIVLDPIGRFDIGLFASVL